MIEPVLLISVLVFVTVISFALGVAALLRYRNERRAIVEKIIGTTKPLRQDSSSKNLSLHDGLPKQGPLRILGQLGRWYSSDRQVDVSRMRKLMLRAGYRNQGAILVFFGVKIALAVLLAGIFFLSRAILVANFSSLHIMVGTILAAVAGFYIPNLFVRIKTSLRKESFVAGFPDALDLLVVCVESGMALDAAILRVGHEMRFKNKTVSDEFNMLSLELRAGKSRRDALRNLATRVNIEDVTSLVSLLVQTDKFGTSVAQALRVHSDAMRMQRRLRAEEMAAKVAVKLVVPLILCILPALFVVVGGPAAIRIFRTLLPALGGGG